MKARGGLDVKIHIFLTSALVEGEWSASRSCRFTPWERAPSTHRIGGLEHPRAGLDDMEKLKFFTLLGLELRPLGSPVATPNTLPQYGTEKTLQINISMIYVIESGSTILWEQNFLAISGVCIKSWYQRFGTVAISFTKLRVSG
jgi:hypothetical protein